MGAVSNADATQAEELQKMLGTIATIKTKPDADLPYLIALESMVLTKLREPFVKMQQQAYGQAMGAAPQMPGAPMMGGPPQMMPGPAGAGVAPGPGGGVAGLMGMPALPPIDELRRVLSEKHAK